MLPFITPPAPIQKRRIGNAKVGELELEIRGGLTVGESHVISELLAEEQSSFVRAAQISDAISKEENISLTEAFQIVEGAIGGKIMEPEADAIRLRHAERITEVGRIYARAGQANTEATVTALVRSRCNLPQWSLEDTRSMAIPLFEAIWKLAQEEQASEDLPTNPPTEEELGKQPVVDTSEATRTGRKSSGN